jgi:hypothetical protein
LIRSAVDIGQREGKFMNGNSMLILVQRRVEPLTSVLDALAALIGSKVANSFIDPNDRDNPNPDPFRFSATTEALQVNCDSNKAGYAKAGFYAAGFDVSTATGAAHDPGDIDPVIVTVTPALGDDVKYYPIGIGPGAIMVAKALRGAYVTRTIGPNDDPYIGDNPEQSIQVRCNRADLQRVKDGFVKALFNAV